MRSLCMENAPFDEALVGESTKDQPVNLKKVRLDESVKVLTFLIK